MNKKNFDELIDSKQQQFNNYGSTDLYSYVEMVRKNRENVPEEIDLNGKYTRADLREILSAMELIDKMRGLL